MSRIYRLALTLFVPLWLGACAAPIAEQQHAGFLSDYAQLLPDGKSAYRYINPDIVNYRQIVIDAPVFLLDDAMPDGKDMFAAEELEALSEHVVNRLTKVLGDEARFEIVDEAGPGVARVRVALTALDASKGLLNLTLYTKVTGAGLGGAAMEGEVVDSVTNEQLAATVQWGNDSRFLRAGLTRLGGAKLQINRWVKSLRQRVEQADAAAAH